jgi:undecaprenyl-diphosphatase
MFNMLKAWEGITWFGGWLFFGFIILISALRGMKEFAYLLFIGSLCSLLLTVGIRTVYFKHRPKKQKYSSYLEKLDSSSFPSLHTMRSCMGAVLVYATFGGWIALIAIVLAVLIGVSRYMLRRHYIIDTVAGALLGILIGIGLLII